MDFRQPKPGKYEAVCSYCAAPFLSPFPVVVGNTTVCPECFVRKNDLSKSSYFTRFTKTLSAALGIPVTVVRVENAYDFLAGEPNPKVVCIAEIKADNNSVDPGAEVVFSSKDAKVKDAIKKHYASMGSKVFLGKNR